MNLWKQALYQGNQHPHLLYSRWFQWNLHNTNCLYVPDLLLPLVSPQHWGQAIEDGQGTYVMNNSDECKICWGGGKHCKTIQHDKSTNTPTLRTAAGTIKYCAFEACFQAMDASHLWHQIEFYQLPNGTADLPGEFIADKLIHQQSPECQTPRELSLMMKQSKLAM